MLWAANGFELYFPRVFMLPELAANALTASPALLKAFSLDLVLVPIVAPLSKVYIVSAFEPAYETIDPPKL